MISLRSIQAVRSCVSQMKMPWAKIDVASSNGLSRRILIHESLAHFLWRILSRPHISDLYWIPSGLVDQSEEEDVDAVGLCEQTSGEAEEDISNTYNKYCQRPYLGTIVEGQT